MPFSNSFNVKNQIPENKTKPTSVPVKDFIAAIENCRRHANTLTSLAMYDEITSLPAVMWGPSIIGFGSYYYVYESRREGDCFLRSQAEVWERKKILSRT